jgi:hypothetical protein
MIWIHKAVKNIVINYTYWSERIIKVELNIGREKLSFVGLLGPRKRKS